MKIVKLHEKLNEICKTFMKTERKVQKSRNSSLMFYFLIKVFNLQPVSSLKRD